MVTKSTNSILDMIAETEQSKRFADFDVAAEVSFVLACPKLKSDRDVNVLTARYGLGGDKPKTLEEIGKENHITRERVRQVEKNAMRKLTEYVSREIRGQEIMSTLENRIAKDGGVVTKNRFYELIIGSENASPKNKHIALFLANLNPKLYVFAETNELKGGVRLAKLEPKVIEGTTANAIRLLESTQKPIEEKTFLETLERTEPNISDELIIAIVSLSKKILRTEAGHLGLANWREINPKSIRDKTYYVLKKFNKPLHFVDISKHIEALDENKKKVTKQAVHNELIRDERFVLIGRGIYALSEWGYSAGVVEDVIEEVLITAGKPMHKDDIINEVKKRRMVKETTILLNLQKDRFERVARATYTVVNRRG